jgi:hypothetical protein
MAEQQTGIISRIAHFFGRRPRIDDENAPRVGTTLDENGLPIDNGTGGLVRSPADAGRGSIFRPWAKRDVALQNLSESFVTLTQLMSAIRESLERQHNRQDEFFRLLGQLPQVIETIPESHRTQADAMRNIYDQLAKQNNAQATLGEVLGRIVDTSSEQRKLIEAFGEQLDGLRQTDASISSNLASVGTAMQTLGQNSQTSANVLVQVQEGLRQRDEAVQQILQRQNQRFNFILWLSVVLAITTILSLVMVTYLAMRP